MNLLLSQPAELSSKTQLTFRRDFIYDCHRRSHYPVELISIHLNRTACRPSLSLSLSLSLFALFTARRINTSEKSSCRDTTEQVLNTIHNIILPRTLCASFFSQQISNVTAARSIGQTERAADRSEKKERGERPKKRKKKRKEKNERGT